jgi:hypothetical protein
MSAFTAEQLREYPDKETPWTPEEALATIEVVDGYACIHGIPIPPYVRTRPDRVRWANSQRVAVQTTGEPADRPLVWQMTRTLYHDRETYKD